jgi:tetratricopeptide (TPR) repeat protein/TolB-like protein/predicted Ser/Thr protein kinase
MIGQTMSHFRIVDKIGEGGMGVVYRAEDLDLGRQVALKVLHTEFVTDQERRQRFLREARTAASVTHPNIATVHEIGEHEGVIFIAMELVEGRTLKRALREDGHEFDECLRLALEICEGLTRAHQANIVHRDLKPENIVIDNDGRVKILDFGLAKLYEDPTGDPADDSSGMQTISAAVTRDGRILGTVQYMSPEQARGVEVDCRSDVFSLGIVLYEMITGQAPFHGETITDTLTAILRDEQEPIARFNPQVPVEFERILRCCLEKDPQDRYQNATAVLADLRKLKRMSDSQPVPLVSDPGLMPRRRGNLPWKRVAGLAAAAVLLVAIGAGAAAVVHKIGWLPGGAARTTSLAVLPFDNLQERDDPERLGQILQELVITDLSEMDSLKVLSSQRLFDVQKQLGRAGVGTIDRDIATQVAEEAGAEVMLTGTLSRLGSTWILTYQLIDVDDGTVIKSERLDGADIYGMVDDLTTVIRGDLGVDQTVDVAVTQRTTSSLEAYQRYLTGVDELNELNFGAAAEHFEDAVEVDPSFGKAYYKLAISRWWQSSLEGYQDPIRAGAPANALKDLLGGETKLSRKDRLLAEAFLKLVEMTPAEAEPLFAAIVEEYPDEKEAWYGLGEARFHRTTSPDERGAALQPFERARALDPSFSLAFYHIVDLYIQDKRYDEGIERVLEFIEQDPDNLSWYQDWARLAVAKGDTEQIDAVLDESLRRIDGREDQRQFLLGAYKIPNFQDNERKQQWLLRAQEIETDAFEEQVLVGLGEQAVRRGDYDEAEDLLLKALELAPHDLDALNKLFWLYDVSRDYEQALRQARELTQEDPDFAPYYGYWVAAAIKKGDEKEIKAAMSPLEQMDSDGSVFDSSMIAIGKRSVDAYFRVGDFVRAEQLLQRGLSIEDPIQQGGVFTSMGRAMLKLARPEEAATWFERALETGVEPEDPIVGLIEANYALGTPADAIQHAERLVKMHGAMSWSRSKLIETHLRAGDEAAVEKLTEDALEALKDERERRMLFRELARSYQALGRSPEAEAWAMKALELTKEHDLKLDEILAWSLMTQGRPEEAAKVIEAGLDTNPGSAELILIGAFNQLAAGNAKSAEASAQDLLDRGPVLADAHAVMAYALGQQGRFGEAVDHAERAMAMTPDRSNRTLMSWVLVAGDIDVDRGMELAVQAMETPESYFEAAKEMSSLALAEHCLGVAYLKQGRYEEAVEQLSEASRIRPDSAIIREQLEQANAHSVR